MLEKQIINNFIKPLRKRLNVIKQKRQCKKLGHWIKLARFYHKKNLEQVKSSVDHSNAKRDQYHKKLLQQHSKYVQAVQTQKNKQLLEQNNKVVNRIVQIQTSRNKKLILQSNLADFRHSITTKSFDNIMTSKKRFRQKKNNQIQIQNMKMTQRLISSRSKQSFGRKSCRIQAFKIDRDLSLLGRYSERSQSVLSDLIFKNLNLKNQNIPFLPQILKKHMSNKSKNTLTKRSTEMNNSQHQDQLLLQDKPTKKQIIQKNVKTQMKKSFVF